MTQSNHGWQKALLQLPTADIGRWAVTGSAALALQDVAVEPRDVEVIAEESAALAMIGRLGVLVVEDEALWDRGDVRAARRSLGAVEGVEPEILVGVETHASGAVQRCTPDLSQVDLVTVEGAEIPVLRLESLIQILEAMGKNERVAMANHELLRRSLTVP